MVSCVLERKKSSTYIRTKSPNTGSLPCVRACVCLAHACDISVRSECARKVASGAAARARKFSAGARVRRDKLSIATWGLETLDLVRVWAAERELSSMGWEVVTLCIVLI